MTAKTHNCDNNLRGQKDNMYSNTGRKKLLNAILVLPSGEKIEALSCAQVIDIQI